MNKWVLPLIVGVYLACSLWGFDWGLYSDRRSSMLFPDGTRWTPGKVAAKLPAERSGQDESRGADVDPNPAGIADTPVVLNDDDARVAEIYARYLLYSNQPDEMITFRALAAMDPAHGDFDPKLYQYGGLFIYPLGALLKAASLIGWVQLGDLNEVLQDPHSFTRYYIVARLYVVFWGLLGVGVVWAIGHLLAGGRGGLLSALCFCMMPVVVTLSHECKPHLPAAVLMLSATFWALRYVESGLVKYRLLLALSCGLATSMVISSLWIFALIPLAEMLTRSRTADRLGRTAVFGLIGVGAYALTNPYVLWNLYADRELLMSNLGNSVAMYDLDGLGASVASAMSLLVDASAGFIVVGGAVMLVALWGWNWRRALMLMLPAALVIVQFVLLAAGKPGEYARFSVFPNVILAIALSVGLCRFLGRKRYQVAIYAAALTVALAAGIHPYLQNLRLESTTVNSRFQLAAMLQPDHESPVPPDEQPRSVIGVLREPAPYGFPPLDFGRHHVVLLPKDVSAWPEDRSGWPSRLIVPLNGVEDVDLQQVLDDGYYELAPHYNRRLPRDRTPITWANKPLVLLTHQDGG